MVLFLISGCSVLNQRWWCCSTSWDALRGRGTSHSHQLLVGSCLGGPLDLAAFSLLLALRIPALTLCMCRSFHLSCRMAYVLTDTAGCWALKWQLCLCHSPAGPLTGGVSAVQTLWMGASALETPEPSAGRCIRPSIPPSAPQVVSEHLLRSAFPKPCLELGEVSREGAREGPLATVGWHRSPHRREGVRAQTWGWGSHGPHLGRVDRCAPPESRPKEPSRQKGQPGVGHVGRLTVYLASDTGSVCRSGPEMGEGVS